ncbi:unnamed protein product [Linum tenue]|uniref:Ribosomal protein S14 n=1 Tax=Linum tenue TaxID=586396 RepID=A0AAV0R5S1_9ROSI|nr:unnamed protein product [Linum tenue]
MEVQPKSSRKEKKAKRQEVLERKKKIDKLIQTASSEHDHLSSFPPFRRFDRNGNGSRPIPLCNRRPIIIERLFLCRIVCCFGVWKWR